MAVITKFLLGSLNGLLGPIKACAAEIFREEYQALGMSTISSRLYVTWGILWSFPELRSHILVSSLVISWSITEPAEKYPTTFSKDSVFGRFPYFLPCLCISLFSLVVAIGSFWLPETLHIHDSEMPPQDSYKVLEAASDTQEGNESIPKENLFKNWALMSSIIIYCIFALHDMAYSEEKVGDAIGNGGGKSI